jgi:hypothetical protein
MGYGESSNSDGLTLRQTILFGQSHSRSRRALIAACIFVSIEVSHHISTSAGLKVIALNVRGVMPPFVASLIPLTTSCFSPKPGAFHVTHDQRKSVRCSNVSLETRSALTKGMSSLCTAKKLKRMSLARARMARQVSRCVSMMTGH